MARMESPVSQGITTRIRYGGQLVTFRALCKLTGLSYYVIWRRYSRGDRGARLVRPVESKYGHRGQWGESHALTVTAS